jgi:hypothetical protein
MMTGHQINPAGTDRSGFVDLVVHDPELLDAAFASIVEFNWGTATPSRPRPGRPQRPDPHGRRPRPARSPRCRPARHAPVKRREPRGRAPPTPAGRQAVTQTFGRIARRPTRS